MVKHVLIYSVVAVGIIACQQQTQEELRQMEAKKVIGSHKTIRRSLSDVQLNTVAFCPSQRSANCAEQLNDLQHRLNDLNPVPVPRTTTDRPVSTAEATRLYKKFVAEHTGEPVLTIFQQLYPRILLNKYGVLSSTDYGLIVYFLRELVESGSYDFDTQAKAFEAIQPHTPTLQFRQLIQPAAAYARLHKPSYQLLSEMVLARLEDSKIGDQFLSEGIREQIVAQHTKESQAFIQAMDRIEQLQIKAYN